MAAAHQFATESPSPVGDPVVIQSLQSVFSEPEPLPPTPDETMPGLIASVSEGKLVDLSDNEGDSIADTPSGDSANVKEDVHIEGETVNQEGEMGTSVSGQLAEGVSEVELDIDMNAIRAELDAYETPIEVNADFLSDLNFEFHLKRGAVSPPAKALERIASKKFGFCDRFDRQKDAGGFHGYIDSPGADNDDDDDDDNMGAGGDHSNVMDQTVPDSMGVGAPAPTAAAAPPQANLLDMDNLMGDISAPAPGVALKPSPTIDPGLFQQKWGSLPQSGTLELQLPGPPPQGQLERSLAAKHIVCMASGTVGDQMKFYFYAEKDTGGFFLVETILNLTNSSLRGSFKSDHADLTNAFVDVFRAACQ
eukprot:GFYU01006054.1.p1 GENE.GFYU01006054.1~~GFYU01006054.1.p1  ORF type:complete len:364 (-),score=78.54 GFYU01006054.1:72-1163(-)